MNDFVFLGDSVTDCSRKRALRYRLTNEGLGNGWVAMVNQTLVARSKSNRIWNCGFSGALTGELMKQQSWWPVHEHANVHSHVTTLMIGINDVWHPFWKSTPHDLDFVLECFSSLIDCLITRSERILVCEPIALPTGEVNQQWWQPLEELCLGQQQICRDKGVFWLGLQERLMQDSKGKYSDYLSDGVHPTSLGHRWLSKQWLNFAVNNDLLSA